MEQIAILGVVVFAFIALFHSFNTIRSLKKMSKRRDGHRPRRPISSPSSARSMAEGLIREVGAKHGALCERAKQQGAIGPELREALEEPRQYFRERVDVRCRPIFNQVIDERILGLEPEREGQDPPRE